MQHKAVQRPLRFELVSHVVMERGRCGNGSGRCGNGAGWE